MSEVRELSNALLKEVFTDAVASRSKCTDVNAITEQGIYSVYNATNGPKDAFGILLHLKVSSGIYAQLLLGNYGHIYYRTHWGSEGWGSWYKISATFATATS